MKKKKQTKKKKAAVAVTELKPRILYFDIETAGVNALKSDLGFCILFGYKWSDEPDAKIIKITKEDLGKFNDKALLQEASGILAEADLIVGHFASVFDRRFIQGRLLINDLPPIPNTKLRDTCMIARSVANFSSNRLKHLAKLLNLQNQKLSNDWPNAWFKVMQGDSKALDGLAEYCKGDVLALEELYQKLQPYDNAAPRLFVNRSVCGACGGEVQYRGKAYVSGNTYRRYQCKSCSKWGRETKRMI